MKKLFLLLPFFVLAPPTFACWLVRGTLGIDGETYRIDQKLEHGKEYLFPLGSFILKMTMRPGKEQTHTLLYAIQERKEKSISDVTDGDEEIKEGESREIYAKGKPGQPNSIITVKITHI